MSGATMESSVACRLLVRATSQALDQSGMASQRVAPSWRTHADTWRVTPGVPTRKTRRSTQARCSSGEGAEGDLDWRTFRARLVAQRQALESVSGASACQQTRAGLELWQSRMSLDNWALLASQNPQLAREVPWAHPTAGPEVGGILLAAPATPLNKSSDQRYWQTVILLTQHDARGSAGLILNRPSGYTLRKAIAQASGVDASLSVFAGNAIYVGGYRSDGRTLHLLHGHPLPGAEELVPGVHLGGLDAAAERVLEGSLESTDFRFFVGRVEWSPGGLEDEVGRGVWYTAACARSLLLKQCLQLPKPLWREMLELMGGEYADVAKKEFGERK